MDQDIAMGRRSGTEASSEEMEREVCVPKEHVTTSGETRLTESLIKIGRSCMPKTFSPVKAIQVGPRLSA